MSLKMSDVNGYVRASDQGPGRSTNERTVRASHVGVRDDLILIVHRYGIKRTKTQLFHIMILIALDTEIVMLHM